MSLPSVNGFGVVVNPLVFSLYLSGGNHGGGPPNNVFELLSGQNFLLLNGTLFLLLMV